ncbi:MAG: OmpA family protein [Bacteroidales bacterium]|nr:OmpA family protein [Candidatus Physcocola equi]
MKKHILSLAICAAAVMEATAIETKFLEKYEFVPSKYEIAPGTNISMMGKKVVFYKNGEPYSAEISDTLDLENATIEASMTDLAIQGQFAYDQASKTIIYSSNGQLFSTTQVSKDTWSKPKALQIEGFSATRITQNGSSFAYRRWRYKTETKATFHNPCLSKDGRKLYVSAELENGKGGRDIWVLTKKGDNTWSAPANMGGINTPKNEDFPFLSDSKTIYFSSDRADTLGGWNVFRADLKSGNATMLPKDVNSNSNDQNFIGSNKCVFLLSQRNGGMKIHRPALIPEPVVEEVKEDTVVEEVKVVKKDFNTVVFYFEFDNDKLINSYEKEIKFIIDFINEEPNSRYKVVGHTDERGAANYNLKLSRERAKKVFDLLVQNGVKPEILKTEGYGAQQPDVKGAQTEEEHQKNRRVEIIRIK